MSDRLVKRWMGMLMRFIEAVQSGQESTMSAVTGRLLLRHWVCKGVICEIRGCAQRCQVLLGGVTGEEGKSRRIYQFVGGGGDNI